jgi:hypothetical protein
VVVIRHSHTADLRPQAAAIVPAEQKTVSADCGTAAAFPQDAVSDLLVS